MARRAWGAGADHVVGACSPAAGAPSRTVVLTGGPRKEHSVHLAARLDAEGRKGRAFNRAHRPDARFREGTFVPRVHPPPGARWAGRSVRSTSPLSSWCQVGRKERSFHAVPGPGRRARLSERRGKLRGDGRGDPAPTPPPSTNQRPSRRPKGSVPSSVHSPSPRSRWTARNVAVARSPSRSMRPSSKVLLLELHGGTGHRASQGGDISTGPCPQVRLGLVRGPAAHGSTGHQQQGHRGADSHSPPSA